MPPRRGRGRKRAASGCDGSDGQQARGSLWQLLQAVSGGGSEGSDLDGDRGLAMSSAQPDRAASAAEQPAGHEVAPCRGGQKRRAGASAASGSREAAATSADGTAVEAAQPAGRCLRPRQPEAPQHADALGLLRQRLETTAGGPDASGGQSPLEKVGQMMLEQLCDDDLRSLLRWKDKEIDVISLCAGSEIEGLVGSTLMGLLGGSYRIRVLAEIDKKKQEWLMHGMKDKGYDYCLYDDITTITDPTTCHCVKHQKACDIRLNSKTCAIFLCGWSCKQLSSCNSSVKNRGSVLADGEGSSGSTFWGMLSALDACENTGIYVGENVEEMSKFNSENRTVLLDAFTQRGWVIQTRFIQGLDYGSIASRGRTWIIGLNMKRTGLNSNRATGLLNLMFATVERMGIKRGTFSEEDFMLSDKSDIVKSELRRCAAKKAAKKDDDKQSDKSESWSSQFHCLLQNAGVTWSQCCLRPPASDSQWVQLLPQREQLAIGYSCVNVPNLTYVDTSQTIGRGFTSDNAEIPCLRPGARMCVMQRKPIRWILGYEMLLIHGATRPWLDDRLKDKKARERFSDSFLADLAGNSWVGQVFWAVLAAVLTHAPAHSALAPPQEVDPDVIASVVGRILDL